MFGETEDKITYRLNNCPFCGSVVLRMDKRIFEDLGDTVKRITSYYVHCENCGASGPPNLDPKGAARSWNKSVPHPDPLEEALKKTKLDHALAVIKAVISLVPHIGGAIASLIGDYVPSATQRSIVTAMEILRQKLEQLADRIELDTLNKDEFAELFKSCYLSIVRTQQKVKLNAAAGLIANILLKEGDPEKLTYTELDHFARCLETLSIGAIETLGHAVDIARKNEANDYRFQPVRFNFEELKGHVPETDDFLLMGLVGELNSMNLVHLAGAPTIAIPPYANYPIQSTPLGVRFCERVLE